MELVLQVRAFLLHQVPIGPLFAIEFTTELSNYRRKGGAYVPAMSDQTVIVRNQGRIFLAGPPLVKAATGEIVDEETLGGGEMHARESGVVDYLVSSDEEGIARGREIIADLGAPFPSTSSASKVRLSFKALCRIGNT